MSFYIKNNKNEYVPVSFDQVSTKDWDNKIIVVSIGKSGDKVPESEIEEVFNCLNNATPVTKLKGTSFVLSPYNISFEVLGSVEEVGKQYVCVKINEGDDLSKLGSLQKNARDQLKDKTKKAVIMPTPLTIDEYKEVIEIKQKCDMRRNRYK